MKSKNTVLITFKIFNKSGVLSFLMIHAASLGLIYKKQYIENLEDNNQRVLVSYIGMLKISKQQAIESFEKHPGVIKVEDLVNMDSSGIDSKDVKIQVEKTREPSAEINIPAVETEPKTIADEPEYKISARAQFF